MIAAAQCMHMVTGTVAAFWASALISDLPSCCILSHFAHLDSYYLAGHAEGFCMMCIMQTHITQALSNPGDVIKPMFVINEMRRKFQLQ